MIMGLMHLSASNASKSSSHINHLKPDVGLFSETNVSNNTLICITGSIDVCVGDITTYTAPFTSGYIYQWIVVNGTGVATGNTFTVTWGNFTSGVIKVKIKDALGNTVNNCDLNVKIHALPNPFITASFSPSCGPKIDSHIATPGNPKGEECIKACDSSTVIYSTPLNPGSTYTWAVSGAIAQAPSNNTISVTWGNVGTGSISVTETNVFGCSKTTIRCITIIESPKAAFTTLPAAVGGIVNVCNHQSVQFLDQSYLISPSTVTNWYWTFGDGYTSTLQNPTHQYTYIPLGINTYTAWLHVENECHCKDSIAVTIVVDSLSGPDITCVSTICENGTSTYTTSATCSIYNWSVVGGTITSSMPYGNTINVNWTTNAGPGIVTLSVSGCSPAMLCNTPTSIIMPIITSNANISGPSVVCSGTFNNYSLNYMPGCTYSWTVSGGGIITAGAGTNNITIFWPFSSLGGTVTVAYNNTELKCTGLGTLNVVVRPSFTLVGSNKICLPSTGVSTYSASGSNPSATFNWQLLNASSSLLSSGGPSTSFNVNWSSYAPGNYQIIATEASALYCNSPQSLFITVYPPVPTPISLSGANLICPNSSYLYSAAPLNSNYYLSWSITGGTPTTGVGNTMSVTWNPTGPYIINLYQVAIAAPNCVSAPYIVNVSPIPIIAPVISGVFTTCNNSVLNYSAAPSNATIYNWTITPAIAGSVTSGQGTANIIVQWNNYSGSASLNVNATYCTGSISSTQTITLTAPPAPVINPIGLICSGQSVSLTSSTSASGYAWSIVSGPAIGTNNLQPYTFSTPGNYLVSLTVTNPGGCIGSSTITKWVTVYQSPSAYITTPNATVYCPGDPISTVLTCNTQIGNNIVWSPVGSGNPYTAIATGSYTAIVTNSNGCQTTSNVINIIYSPLGCPPVPCYSKGSIAMNVSPPNCNTVYFSGITFTGILPNWDFGDNSNYSGLNPGSHTYNQAGNYYVNFSGTFGSCIKSVTTLVTIPAVADFEWKVNGCTPTGYSYDFIDKSNYLPGQSINYSWNFPGGGTSTLANPTGIVLTTSGTVTLNILSIPGGTSCTKTYNIVVPAYPTVSISSPNVICNKSPITFTGSPTTFNTWLWNFGDGSTSTLPIASTHTYNLTLPPATQTVSLTVTDIYGCAVTKSVIVTVVKNNLNTVVTPSGPTTFCQGGNVVLASSTTGGMMPYTYLWSNASTTPNISVNQTGIYNVIVSDAFGCKKMTPTTSVTVKPAPIPNIVGKFDYCVGETVSLNANQGSTSTYQWTVNGNPSGGGPILTYLATTAGTLNVQVTITGPNGCSASSAIVPVIIHALPAPPVITSNPSGTLCSGSPITLTASGAAPSSSYNWSNSVSGPITIVNTGGVYTSTITDVFGCKSQSSITVFDLPNFENLMTGCYEFCDTINGSTGVNWIGPVGVGYTYQWFYNSSPIPGPAGTSANYFIPVSASGVYTLAITVNGCTSISNTIDVSFKNCTRCFGTSIGNINISCGPINAQSIQTYTLSMQVNNPFPSGTSYILSVVGNTGSISGVTPTTLVNGINTINAIYTPITPMSQIVIHFIIISNQGTQCDAMDSAAIPNCAPPCTINVKLLDILCNGLDASGNQTYVFNLDIPWNGNNGNIVTITSPDGTVTSLSTNSLNNGSNPIKGIFTDILPLNAGGQICFNISITDPLTLQNCVTKFCFTLPICSSDGWKLSQRINATNRLLKNGTVHSESLNLAPNPSLTKTTVNYDLNETSSNSIEIRNMFDQVIEKILLDNGKGEIEINTSHFTPGTYNVVVYHKTNMIISKRLIVMKQ
jgi:PKD domain/PKD-like domain/Secretion system C-terminal sorting domain